MRLYSEGLTGDAVASRLGVSRDVIYKGLRRLGIQCRSSSVVQQRYPLDSQYFSDINSEEKAYWLGFIAADGNVYKNILQVDLQRRDRPHLEKLRKALNAGHPITDRANGCGGVQSRFAVSNAELVRGLALSGILPRKSQTYVPWAGEEELVRHFWRGMVDGDGCLTFNRKWSLRLEGSQQTCEAFLTIIQGIVPTTTTVKKGHGNVWTVRISGMEYVRRVVAWLYEDAKVQLDRKGALAKEIMALPPSDLRRPPRRNLIVDEHHGRACRIQEEDRNSQRATCN